MAMAMADAGDEAFNFLSDPVDRFIFSRFPLLDLAVAESLMAGEASQTLLCMATESSIGNVGNAPATLELELNSACNRMALSTPISEHSTGKDASFCLDKKDEYP